MMLSDVRNIAFSQALCETQPVYDTCLESVANQEET
jgi:hypothetical protein